MEEVVRLVLGLFWIAGLLSAGKRLAEYFAAPRADAESLGPIDPPAPNVNRGYIFRIKHQRVYDSNGDEVI